MEYNADKMEVFLQQDMLLSFVVKDLTKRGISREEAKEITFNAYVLDDVTMSETYAELSNQRIYSTGQ